MAFAIPRGKRARSRSIRLSTERKRSCWRFQVMRFRILCASMANKSMAPRFQQSRLGIFDNPVVGGRQADFFCAGPEGKGKEEVERLIGHTGLVPFGSGAAIRSTRSTACSSSGTRCSNTEAPNRVQADRRLRL